jgi:hypothetical protein
VLVVTRVDAETVRSTQAVNQARAASPAQGGQKPGVSSLADAAEDAGVQLRFGLAVTDLARDGAALWKAPPYVDGRTGFQSDLSDRDWVELGEALRAVHATRGRRDRLPDRRRGLGAARAPRVHHAAVRTECARRGSA